MLAFTGANKFPHNSFVIAIAGENVFRLKKMINVSGMLESCPKGLYTGLKKLNVDDFNSLCLF